MTSDAKIGLLLGLVFIFVIAFIINGLPGLHGKEDGNKLTTNMIGLENNSSGLGAHERKVVLVEPGLEAPPAESSLRPAQPDTRFTMSLPQSQPASPSTKQTVVVVPVESAPAGPDTKSRPDLPAYYVVEEGDNLSSIAKKFYGERQGNILANVKAIFEANRGILSSMDDIRAGQKIVVPRPAGDALSGPGFEKADSIGKRHLPAGPGKPSATGSGSSAGTIYVVRQGDSLWQIAAAQLGNGSRYREIAKLNSDVLTSEDDLEVGMRLKLPAQ